MTDAAWAAYLDRFHAEHPGITEDVLSRCRADGESPYAWLVEDLDPAARILDVACGSGPAMPPGASRWTGLDRSAAELRRAGATRRASVVLGDATDLPFAGESVDAVTCSMAMMLVQPLERALAEVARVLRPGGTFALLLPARAPLTTADRGRYLGLFWAARSTTKFPPTALRSRAGATLTDAGFDVESDEARRFGYPLDGPEDADRFVDSWYLPATAAPRRAAARRRAADLAPMIIGIPLRRMIVRRQR